MARIQPAVPNFNKHFASNYAEAILKWQQIHQRLFTKARESSDRNESRGPTPVIFALLTLQSLCSFVGRILSVAAVAFSFKTERGLLKYTGTMLSPLLPN